ncbi:response regulator [Brevibacillus brevis]|uniref:Response regulator n=1 Tax=Brevibacillus brevis TaxID=1393 RepID=A0ABY9T0E6_BREBE|nr:response regulator [Brevibacillus brevis]WNC13428.1 response regulator [Brevibacillus brevis]
MNSIMIVDVAAFTRLMLRNIFESLGFEVIAEADNGKEAVRNYRLYRPSLVLIDIAVQDMDGLTASREILKYDQEAKIIICSAITDRATVIGAVHMGVCDFIAKPLQKERVEWAIEHILGTEMRNEDGFQMLDRKKGWYASLT